MAHGHSVYNTDERFTIDIVTRAITQQSGKSKLMQYDHNSERYEFEMDRYIDGHDMSLCNDVRVNYLNIASSRDGQTNGPYVVKDMQVSPDDENKIVFSWLISRNSTKYAGTLNFNISFRCLTGAIVDYAWYTDIFKGITVSTGIENNGNEYVEEYIDILEQWKQDVIENLGSGTGTVTSINGVMPDENGNVQIEIPEGFSGDYNDLTNKPVDHAVWHELVEVENRHGLFHNSVFHPNEQSVYTQYVTKIYDVSNCEQVRINGTTSGNTDSYNLLDANKKSIARSTVRNLVFKDEILDVSEASFLALSSKSADFWGDEGLRVEAFSQVESNPWRGFKIVWFGTSIPQGGGRFAYPMLVGRMLGANVKNEAVGSSPVHAQVLSRVSDTNPHGFDANFDRSSRALLNTTEQMQWIANWADYKVNGGTYQNAEAWDESVFEYNIPTSWTEDDTAKLLSYSYEARLDPYLTDDTFPDLFVFNHGYNDVTSTSDDLGLYDSMMDTEGRHNPYTFRGGMNFLIDRILTFKPQAQIVIVGEYDKTLAGKDNIYKYQIDVANDYQIPLLPMWAKLGLSQNTVQVNGAWNNGTWEKTSSGAITLTMMAANLPDGVHPHSDKSGGINRRMATIVAEWLKTLGGSFSSSVTSINGITPDSNGNVQIEVLTPEDLDELISSLT